MNLEQQQKVKFWLWTITKILGIGYILVRGSVFIIERIGSNNASELNTTTKIETAKLEIDDNVFSWAENNRKAILRIKNYASVEGINLTVNAIAHYATQGDRIQFDKGEYINPNGIVVLKSKLDGLPLGMLPDSITVCIVHENENTKLKTWNKFRLKGFNTALTRPMFEQATYNVRQLDKKNFKDSPPNCIKDTKIITFSETGTRADRIDSLSLLKEIKRDAHIFLMGLNHKALSKVEKYASKPLVEHLKLKDNDFEFGFNTEVTILNHASKTAYIKLFLTSEGWSHYLAKDFYYQMQNINKNSESFYDFLEFEDNTWNGKLVKENGIWKFMIHENSAIAKRNSN